jgi:Tol biopolymer transport system component
VKLRLSISAALLFLLASCSGGSTGPASPTQEQASPLRTPERGLAATPIALPYSGTQPTLRPAGEPISQGGHYALDTVTGDVWRLGELGSRLAWAPDGDTFAIGHCCLPASFLEIVDLSARAAIRLDVGPIWALVWSPSGERLAYTRYGPQGAEHGVFVVERDGSSARQVSELGGGDQVRWLDDRTLAILTSAPPEASRYELVDVFTLAARTVEAEDPLSGADPRIVFGTPSPDGEWVAFLDGPSAQASFLWRRSTGEVRRISDSRLSFSWSPNSQRLLVASTQVQAGEAFPIYLLYETRTGQFRELPTVGIGARWLSDGDRVVYSGFRCLEGGSVGSKEIFVALADGSGTRSLTPGLPDSASQYELSASPVGTMVAFVRLDWAVDALEWRLLVVDADSGAVGPSVLGPEVDLHVHGDAWSPNGRYLRFHASGGHGICN